MHAALHRHPLGGVAAEIALVHCQWYGRQLHLADQVRHPRQLGRRGMPEGLALADQPSQLVAAHPRRQVSRPVLGIQHSNPAGEELAGGPHPELTALQYRDRRGRKLPGVHRDPQRLSQQGPVGVSEALRQAPRINPLVHPVDPDPHVTLLRRHPLANLEQLVRLEPRPLAVLRVAEAPGQPIARTAGLHRERPAEVPDRSLAALAVLPQETTPALRRAAPAQVVALELARPHPLAALSVDHDSRGVNQEVHPVCASRDAGVKGVVDQLHDGVGRAAIVGEQRGRDPGSIRSRITIRSTTAVMTSRSTKPRAPVGDDHLSFRAHPSSHADDDNPPRTLVPGQPA